MPKRKSSAIQYRFKVNLKRRRSIWRSVVLRGDQSLEDLHHVIFTAFDRDDCHLYCFYFPKAPARRSRSGEQPRSYVAPEGCESFAYDHRESTESAILDDLNLRVGQKFEYVFDFGDEWWHEITVEKIDPSEPDAPYPRLVGQRGSSPPQYPDIEE